MNGRSSESHQTGLNGRVVTDEDEVKKTLVAYWSSRHRGVRGRHNGRLGEKQVKYGHSRRARHHLLPRQQVIVQQKAKTLNP